MYNWKNLASAFEEFSASIDKTFIWQGDWALGYHSMKFRQFSDISKVPNILNLK